MSDLPEINPADLAVLEDPFTAYGRARESAPLARMPVPGLGALWIVTRYAEARAMLSDPRFEVNSASFLGIPGIPEEYRPYLRTMSEMDGPDHLRLRRLVAPAFAPRGAAAFRPRIEAVVESLLDALPPDGPVDVLAEFARPLPMDVICALVGIPEHDRPQWRQWGASCASGVGPNFFAAMPGIIEGAKAAVARRREEPADDLLSELVRAQAEDGDRLSDTELVTLVWHLVLAGQTPANLIVNAVEALLAHPGQLAALRADPDLMPGAVEELTRLYSPQLLTTPRFAREDTEIAGCPVGKGTAVTAAMVAANRDPRVYADPDRLDVTRPGPAHLAFSHGPHFCLGASIARVETEVALTALIKRFPGLALAEPVRRAPDGGTWRPAALLVTR